MGGISKAINNFIGWQITKHNLDFAQKQMEKNRQREIEESKYCSVCGKKGTISKCSWKDEGLFSFGGYCPNHLCKNHAKKCKKCGKFFCPEHINNHKCK